MQQWELDPDDEGRREDESEEETDETREETAPGRVT